MSWFGSPSARTLTGVALRIEVSKAFRFHGELEQLLRAVLEAGSADERHWIEWKGTADLGSNADVVKHVARHILAFANRDPATAGPFAQGYGYLIVGLEPGQAVGIMPLDPAQLVPQITKYVGQRIAWNPDYVAIDGADVLVIAVDPPRPGDPIHTLEHDFAEFLAGTVYVRRQGSTNRANPDEMRMLERRLRASTSQLELGIDLTASTIERWPDADDVETWLTAQQRRLLRYLRHPAERVPPGLYATVDPDSRTEDQYRQKVDLYIVNARRVLTTRMRVHMRETGRHVLGLVAHNPTETGLEEIELRVHVAGAVSEIPARDDWHIRMPEAPRPFGEGTACGPFRIGDIANSPQLARLFESSLRQPVIQPPYMPSAQPPYEIRSAGSIDIKFKPFDLRPESQKRLTAVPLMVTEPVGTDTEVTWSATARNMHGRRRGSTALTVVESPLAVETLLDDGLFAED